MLTVTDIFAGAGGSSTGAAAVPGVQIALAANHWRLAEVEVVDVRREALRELHDATDPRKSDFHHSAREASLEGFPYMNPREFVQRYFIDAQGMSPDDEVTRIEWRYLDEEAGQ